MTDIYIYVLILLAPALILLGFDQEISAIFLQKIKNNSGELPKKSYNQLIIYWWVDKKFRKNTIILVSLIYIGSLIFLYTDLNFYTKIFICAFLALIFIYNTIKRFQILKDDTLILSKLD